MHAFVIAYAFDVHFADGYAQAAVGALVLIEFYAEQGDTAEETVQRAERTQKAAEYTEHENTADDNQHEEHEFPSEQRPENAQQALVYGVAEQADAPLERTCRADIFAEAGYGENQRDEYDQNDEHYVFEIGQHARGFALFKLRRFDLIQQFLSQTDGAEETANRPAEQQSEEYNNAEYVGRRARFRRQQGILQRT